MKKKIIICLSLLLIIAVSSGLIYLNNVYLPVKLRALLINGLESSLGYNAKIGTIKYNLFKGLIIKDILIYDKALGPEDSILSIKETYFNFLFIPLFRERKVIIPVIHIDTPHLNIRYQKDNSFNFSRIFTPKVKSDRKEKNKFSFIIYKINIFDASCAFKDEHFLPEFSKNIRDLNIGLTMKPLAKVSFLAEGKIPMDKEAIAKLSLKGEYDFLAKELKSQLSFVNLNFSEFNPYLETLPFAVDSGTIANSNLDLNFKNMLFSLSGIISAKNLKLNKKEFTLKGDIDIEPKFNYAADKKELNYETNFKFIRANISGVEFIKTIDNITGDMRLAKDSLSSDNLKLQALDTDFVLSGSLENFKDPYLKLKFASSEIKLEKIFPFLSLPQDLKLTGIAAVNVNAQGKLNNPPLTKKASFVINNARFVTPALKEPLNNIAGSLNLTSDSAEWQNLAFNYKDTPYKSTGKLADFKEPLINFNLNSEGLNLESELKIKDKIIKIDALAAKYRNSRFDIKGKIDMQNTGNPFLDLLAKINLKVQDAFTFLPANLTRNLKKMKLDGNLNIDGTLTGEAKNYKGWITSAKISSGLISLYDLKLTDLYFNLEEDKGILRIDNFTAGAYDGIINMKLTANLANQNPEYLVKFNSQDIDLAKLKLDTGLKDKNIGGTINIAANLSGNFKDLSGLKGSGFISIKNGILWELNLFKGLGELFLLPDYKKIVFNEADGEFGIENRQIFTDDFKMQSKPLTMGCSGTLDFDGKLDFTIYTAANKNIIKDSVDIRKFITAIIGELSGAIAVKVTGTIQNPKHYLIPMPLDLLKNIKNFILGK